MDSKRKAEKRFKLEYYETNVLKEFQLGDETVKIGKVFGNSIQLSDKRISRFHCQIERSGNGYTLTDLKSTNGTYVNGEKISKTAIKAGDVITLGGTNLKLTVPATGFTDKEISHEVSIVIPLSDVMEELEFQKAEGREQQRFLSSLTALGKKLVSCYSLQDVFRESSLLILESLESDSLSFFTLDPQGRELKPELTQTKTGTSRAECRISKTIAMKAVREKIAILSSDARGDSRFEGAASIIRFGINSALSVPIWTKQTIYGLIYTDITCTGRCFQEKDLERLSVIANFIGLAIERLSIQEQLEGEQRMRNRLERYHSPAVVARLMEQLHQDTINIKAYRESEATVLFLDIVGFTPRSEKMKPAQVGMLLNDFFSEMTEIIFNHDGTLDKYIGDGLMAVFGVPFQLKNHPYKAVLSACAIMDKLKERNSSLSEAERIHVRIGIHSGSLISGDFGSPKRLDYTVLGSTVNIASRLESVVAQADQIVVSKETLNGLKDSFSITPLGGQRLPGISLPVEAYQITGPR